MAFRDDQAWATAQRGNSVASYQEYLKTEVGGVHADDARYQLTGFERATAWKSVQSDPSVASLEQFLQKYPEGAESNEARQKLDSMAYRVQLAEAHNKAGAERKRAELQARFGTVVHGLVVVPPVAPDTHYQVSSGPMSRADADSACAALERKHQHCAAVKGA
ncbi:MAG: SPOR domain-containing protein [Gammaproteobacteria bacterium]